jgi:hypothetical protein
MIKNCSGTQSCYSIIPPIDNIISFSPKKSTELALIENLPGSNFVSVTPARLEQGRPPAREIGGGILINPRGSFIGQSMLEATFSIDESLLAGGCKEFLV